MKKRIYSILCAVAIVFVALVSCKKEICQQQNHQEQLVPKYSTLQQFKEGIAQVAQLLQSYRINAYLDTLPNGYPNVNGPKTALAGFAYSILEKLNGNQQQVQSAVYDVFHFDEATFSLISYIMKAQMAGEISAQTAAYILSFIPLPPIPVPGFNPPVVNADTATGDCCKDNVCDPKIKIRVTWSYKPPCGNYEKKTSGYAANNTLTGMSGGKMFRFDAEVTGCPCPGTWTSTVTAPAAAIYGTGGSSSSITLLPVSAGTYTITFTYKVCDKTFSKTFTLGIG